MRKLLVFCLLLACSGLVLAKKEQQNYLCTGEVEGGLDFNESTGKWDGGKFDAGVQFLLKVNDKEYPEFAATVSPVSQKKTGIYLSERRRIYICKRPGV